MSADRGRVDAGRGDGGAGRGGGLLFVAVLFFVAYVTLTTIAGTIRFLLTAVIAVLALLLLARVLKRP